jgi:fatty-acyl-CoA synthase
VTDLSYVSGASTQPLLGMTIGACFDATCAAHPQQMALISRHQKIRWTYGQMKARVDALAAGLLALGLEPGERIGIWAPNCAEWAVTQFATAKAGLILVNINPAYRLSEVEYALNKVGCKALVTAVAHKSSEYLHMLRELAPELNESRPGDLQAKRLPALRLVITLGEQEHAGCLAFHQACDAGTPADAERLEEIAAGLQFDEPINIQFTSGTTGFPKGATLSHHNILNNGYFVAEMCGFTEADVVVLPVPFYHCFGMVMGNLGSTSHGSTIVIPSPGFDPAATLRAVQETGATVLYGVPTMFIAELSLPDFASYDLSTLRTGIMAGSPCPVEVMKRVVGEMHMSEVTIAYGMTETSPVSTQTRRDDDLERRVSTVGTVHPHVEVKVVDPESDVTVPRGETGELCTRGYSVMLGYWDEPDKTADVLDATHWMHTGDLATMDADGYVNIVGRIKDLVIRGGENVYPREIEEFLYSHPDIADVQVIGVPDQRYGEELCAWIRVRDGAEPLDAAAVRDYCEGKLAHYKIPRYVQVVDEFPMTVTGKIRKVEMRERSVELLGLQDVAAAKHA